MAHPVNHLLGQGNKLSYVLSHADSTYDMRMAESANTVRHPANQYLLLDSTDRLPITQSVISATTTATPNAVTLQPWNDFQMQRPQSLMEAFAKRLAVTEVRFPWFIPNVNSYNNGFSITTQNSSSTTGYNTLSSMVSLTPGISAPFTFILGMATSLSPTTYVVGGEVTISSTTLTPAVKGSAIVSAWDSTTGLLTLKNPIVPIGTWVGSRVDQWNVKYISATTSIVTIPIGFYTPTALVTAVQAQLTALKTAGTFADPFVFSYDPATFQYSLTMTTNTSGANYAVLGYSNTQTSPTYLTDYNNWLGQANFFNLVGWPFAFCNVELFETAFGAGNPITGSPSETLYTEFVDITSSKAHEFTNMRDGNSGPTSTVSLARLYLADDVAINESTWIGQVPIVIHRQFKNPKYIRFNAESVISWLDIQVRDSWGNLVPLNPPVSIPTVPASVISIPYPDFQITILASED